MLNQEEELWALKSRVNWMIQGDRNTNFYHVSTLIRRKRNQIMTIKNAVGDWIHEEGEIKDFIRCGFERVFLSSFSCVPRVDPTISQWQSRLSDSEKESISGGAFEVEIKAALWSLKPFKTPGRMGFMQVSSKSFGTLWGIPLLKRFKRFL